MQLGLDIGSTTIKLVLLKNKEIQYSLYKRHSSDIKGTLLEILQEVNIKFPNQKVKVSITGSGGVLIAEKLKIPFVQEVIAETVAIQKYYPQTDVIIELGGEDAKLTFLKPSPEQRMNGTCAGGTGSFIDQMAQLMQTDAEGLNELAKNFRQIYPIASRCGVFAKSDIQPLLNEGASKEDLAASVLQAVVIQTIAGLSQGRSIKGNVIFLGGPLHFLSELRKAFIRTLESQVEQFIYPENAQLFVALGAALLAKTSDEIRLPDLIEKFSKSKAVGEEFTHIQPLFKNREDYQKFKLRHDQAKVPIFSLKDAEGPLFLGLDAGSTTTKAVLTDQNNTIVYSYYQSNKGDPIKAALCILEEIYRDLPERAFIARGCTTGYGEALLKTALKLEDGEIETMTHYRAAAYFLPNVDFIVDIGGQDMKCMQVKDGIINNIMLNEACSSGCGSFIQTFANGLNMDVPDFAKEALFAQNPVDLGTRCTVFMNSRVKQAQKEGAGIGDISAGLSYSVVRNALYKVIKLRDVNQLGENIVVQGGTFLNDAILRSFERISKKEVIRPNIAGLMGAFGSALIAKENWDKKTMSGILTPSELANFDSKTQITNCKICQNHCQLTIHSFPSGVKHISGNRCERGAGLSHKGDRLPNMYDYKYKRTFSYYQTLTASKCKHGKIGIPRVLNMYENYPLWHTIFNYLGFDVVLSSRSSHAVFSKGIDSIPSESICYPAKLVHGHIMDLIDRGIDLIFYPDIPYEMEENPNADNHYNCPIVTSYPEVIKNNIDVIMAEKVKYLNPFLPLHHPDKLGKKLLETLYDAGFTDITEKQMKKAVKKGYAEMTKYKEDIVKEGERILQQLEEKDQMAIVLAGRPYHIDPQINHGIAQLINSLGLAVISEDAIADPGVLKRPIRVIDQWMYHSRLYEAAAVVAKNPRLELVQLNSFGCGLDAITTDQTEEILSAENKLYTCLKIDETSNLGAARIRLRSLQVAMQERLKWQAAHEKLLAAKEEAEKAVRNRESKNSYAKPRIEFTKEMRETYTILAPQMAPIQFSLIEPVLRRHHYKVEILKKASAEDIETGLKFVNNDACYPTIIVVGQMMNAILSGKYDVNKTAFIITQTGGGCRATNYVAFLRKALCDANLEQVPVIALSANGIEENSGVNLTLPLLHHAVQAIVLGDLLMTLLLRVRPYELEKGSANALYHKWLTICKTFVSGETKNLGYPQLISQIIAEFDQFPMQNVKRKPRVGVVGEILVKFQPDANNNVVRVIEDEGCEAVVPSLLDFFCYCAFNATFKHKELGESLAASLAGETVIKVLEIYRRHVKKGLAETGKFPVPQNIKVLADYAQDILSLGNATGEGWFLTAEMLELIHSDVPNIIMCQPFACLPNHVTGKGMIKILREKYPKANITPIDYDPGASEVNQLNRIKLMISTAKQNEKEIPNLNESEKMETDELKWMHLNHLLDL